MGKAAVINASPLIFLSRGHHIDLLHHFVDRILVPKPVAEEIMARGPEDETVQAIKNTLWIEIVESPDVPETILYWGLGQGESSVLAFAQANPAIEAIIDDLAGRKCAAYLGIPVRGTLGIVLAAKKRGLIPEARSVMEDIIRSGLFLSRGVLEEALRRVGE